MTYKLINCPRSDRVWARSHAYIAPALQTAPVQTKSFNTPLRLLPAPQLQRQREAPHLPDQIIRLAQMGHRRRVRPIQNRPGLRRRRHRPEHRGPKQKRRRSIVSIPRRSQCLDQVLDQQPKYVIESAGLRRWYEPISISRHTPASSMPSSSSARRNCLVSATSSMGETSFLESEGSHLWTTTTQQKLFSFLTITTRRLRIAPFPEGRSKSIGGDEDGATNPYEKHDEPLGAAKRCGAIAARRCFGVRSGERLPGHPP